jgi:sec-independent protein translocase protein TatA
MPFNLGFGELVLILVVILLFFGARRIPEIMGGFGKGIREFKKSMNDVEREIREPAPPAPLDQARTERLTGADARREADESRPEPKRLIN